MSIINSNTSLVDKLDSGKDISKLIIARIREKQGSYLANDNISEYILEGELQLLIEEVTQKMQDVLDSLCIDTKNDPNMMETAERIARMYVNEVFNGRYVKQPAVKYFPNTRNINSMAVTGPITIRSCCSHHLVPFIGEAFVGILPGDDYPGLSKFNRLVYWVFSRPQIQEEALIQVADILEKELKPKGLGIVITAKHHCVDWRGVKDKSVFTNSELRGEMYSPAAREEFMSLIAMNKGFKL